MEEDALLEDGDGMREFFTKKKRKEKLARVRTQGRLKNSQVKGPKTFQERGHEESRWLIQERKKEERWKKRKKKRRRNSSGVQNARRNTFQRGKANEIFSYIWKLPKGEDRANMKKKENIEVHIGKWISMEHREEVHEKIHRKMRYFLVEHRLRKEDIEEQFN